MPGLFDYLLPDDSKTPETFIGCRVKVPFGPRTLIGWIAAIGVPETAVDKLKPVISVLDGISPLTDEALKTLHWTSQYYQAPLGEVFNTAVPALLRDGKPLPECHEYAWQLTPAGTQDWTSLRVKGKTYRMAAFLAHGRQREFMLADFDADWTPTIRALRKRGWVERVAVPLSPSTRQPDAGPVLNAEQSDCLTSIDASAGFGVHLIDGVTGSGKTEVYIQAISSCLARNRQALILVPEIGLTPQTLARFRARLSVPVHVMHSKLSDGERAKSWAAMASGIGRVLLGTRSAVFTPLPEAGLLIIDEEHDSSYKQPDGFHYHARDVAIVRAKAHAVPILLGSATPSLESLHNANIGRYRHHRLQQRAGDARLPDVRIVDVRKIRMHHGLSQTMLDGIRQCLDEGGQALVFKNRRGYAPALLCHDCGFTALCPRCDTTLTLHQGLKSLQCHHCGFRKAKPPACPDCGSLALQAQGFGTERLEEGLNLSFPDAVCIRVDSASTRGRDSLGRHLEKMAGHPGILVGTQMLAKGHDLPNLRFVGVVGIDESLFSSDFRAHEKLAQLLVQVAGRSGRSQHAGHVLLQTHHPDHPMLSRLLAGGYPAFAATELDERRLADMPPYRFMALLRCESVHLDNVKLFLEEASGLLAQARQRLGVSVHSSGALPAGMPRRAGKHRWQLVLTGASRHDIQQLLTMVSQGLHALKSARKTRWSIDVDPMDFH